MMRALRHIIVIAGNQLRRVALDGALIWLVGLPILIIYVLGITLHGAFATDFSPAEPMRIGLVEHESVSELGVGDALEAMPQFFVIDRYYDEEAARQAVLARSSRAAVIVPPEFPNEPATVVTDPSSLVGEILAGVLASFTAEGLGQDQAFEEGQEANPVTRSNIVENQGAEDVAPIEPGSRPFGAGAFEYYSIAIAVMFAMYAAHSVTVYSVGDRVTGAYVRIRALGVTRTTYMAAGFFGAALTGVVYFSLMSIATRLLFGASWGGLADWAVLTVVGSIALAAVSFLIMAVMPPSPKGVENAGGALITVMAFLGGSTVPLPVLPEWFRASFVWMPNRALLDGYLALASGRPLGELGLEFQVMGIVSALLVASAWLASSVRFKREA